MILAVFIKYQYKADDLHFLVTSILSEFLTNLKTFSFNKDFMDFLKLLTYGETFFPSNFFFAHELDFFGYKKNSMLKDLTDFKKKMI